MKFGLQENIGESAQAKIDRCPSWRKQLQAILSANAKGTVEEFHALLASLGEDKSDTEGKNVKSHPQFVCLCAAVLSAQTRDKATINSIRRLSSFFGIGQTQKMQHPDFSPAALALAPPGALEECLQGVNYFKTKAKRLSQIAALLLSRHKGQVPCSFAELTALPGVGTKVANLVLAVSFPQVDAGMIVDTHVHRVSRRLGWSSGRDPEATRKDLESFVPADVREFLTMRLISFGQEICRPLHPKCSSCPVSMEDLCPTYTRFHAEQQPLQKRRMIFRSLRSTKARKRVVIELEET